MILLKSDFDKAIDFVIKWEGGYVCDPNDPGGETKYGISKKSNPDVDIKKLTLKQAKKIYKERYWDVLDCENFAWPFNLIIFDTGVNVGINRARRILAASKDNYEMFIDLRDNFYRNIAQKMPKFNKYLKGWLNRTADLRKYAGIK